MLKFELRIGIILRETYYLGHHGDIILQIKHLYILNALKNKTHNSNTQHIITA